MRGAQQPVELSVQYEEWKPFEHLTRLGLPSRLEVRTLPGQKAADVVAEVKDVAERTLLPEMRAGAAASRIAFEELSGFPGLDTPDHAEVTELAKSLSGSNLTQKVSFGTEAGLYHEAGIPAVICGPGNISQAHKPNEYVALDQIARCEAFLRRLIERLHRP